MKKISVRLSDTEYENLEMLRGEKTVSDYIKMLLAIHHNKATNENADFHKLFSDVTLIKESLTTSSKALAGKKDLLALATFMAEVASIANPPAYANYRDKIQQLYQTLTTKMRSEDSVEKSR